VWLGERARVSITEEIRGLAGVVREREFIQRKKKTLTGGPGMSARRREKSVPLWGFARLGHGPNRGLGRFVFPGLLHHFFLFSYFPFYVFWFISYPFQIRFKSIQTTS
jgi:hypothetical protein